MRRFWRVVLGDIGCAEEKETYLNEPLTAVGRDEEGGESA